MLKRLFLAIAILALFLPIAALAQTATETPAETPAETGLTLKAEAQICTGIQERMPTGMADSFAADIGQVYLWCKITGSNEETTIKHVWYYQGKEMATVELPVKSSSFRTWSSKKIMPQWIGDWSVKIEDASGNVLKEVSFKIMPAETNQ